MVCKINGFELRKAIPIDNELSTAGKGWHANTSKN